MRMSNGVIRLTGLRAFGYHGVFPEERREGQEFVIDLALFLSFDEAVRDDDVTKTVHYGEIAEAVVAAVERDPVDLIETLAQRIADVVLENERVGLVNVVVHKPNAPITVPFADVSVELSRSRDEPLEPQRVVVAVGANLGDRETTIRSALQQLTAIPGVAVVAVSSLIESVAVTTQGRDKSKPAYLNGIVLVETTLRPEALLAILQQLETRYGRERAERWGDRTLDLDIVDWVGRTQTDARLTLPHPRAAERDFVLRPWLELDPDAVLTGVAPVAELLAALDDAAVLDAPASPASPAGAAE